MQKYATNDPVKSSNQDSRQAQANGQAQEEQDGFGFSSGTKVLTGPVDSDRKQLA